MRKHQFRNGKKKKKQQQQPHDQIEIIDTIRKCSVRLLNFSSSHEMSKKLAIDI